ncbi:TIR domain-containing protein [uncultured Phenylobacterium sp.]|uniref:TIR domain-containing protein n=1 Tax=uncultured Phenylobacterium sp. TaxID=349273 RepID=UPI0025D9C77D|nr:TIR domain-containing protein [uncultured Phenylobacterium sp.]
MAYRNRTFVSFDGDTDMHYYRLMTAWHQNDRSAFSFYNAHDLEQARDTSQEATIKASLARRMAESNVFVLLVGDRTRFLYKFVRWEIEQALSRRLPIIAVNLNGTRFMDEERCPPVLRDKLAIHISFNPAVMQYALETWPGSDAQARGRFVTGPHYFKAEVYGRFGL